MSDYVGEEALADWLDFRREADDFDNGFEPTEQDIAEMDTSGDPCDHSGWDCACEF
jgi:hypothetical protein